MTHAIEALMQQVNGASFISINSVTVPTLRGGVKNPYQGRVRKVMVGASVMVFQNKNVSGYEQMVQRRLVNEGKNPFNFELSPRKWGTRLPNVPIVEHNGQRYLEVIFLRPGKSHFEVEGVVTAPEDIEGLVLEKEEAEQGGLDNKVIIRTFKFDSITALTIGHQRYDL